MIHHPISFSQYCALDGINNSFLKHIDKSPAHLRWHQAHPTVPTPEMLKGSLTDHLFFGTEFNYVVSPYDDFRKKEAQQWRDETEASGVHVFKQTSVDEVSRMVASIRNSPTVAEILRAGRSQVAVRDNLDADGTLVQAKCLIDWVSDEYAILADLKTTGDASEDTFRRHVVNMGYDVQAAMYVDLWKAATGEELPFLWIVTESEEPHATALYQASKDSLARGRAILKARLRKYAICLSANRWDSYPENPVTLEPPTWAMMKE